MGLWIFASKHFTISYTYPWFSKNVCLVFSHFPSSSVFIELICNKSLNDCRPLQKQPILFPLKLKTSWGRAWQKKNFFCYFLKDEQIKGHMTTLSEILANPDFADFHHIVKEVNGMYDWIREKMCSV